MTEPRFHPLDNVIGKLERDVANARDELHRLHRPCGAKLTDDMLGFEVNPCSLSQGHEGEHRAITKYQGEPVVWADETAEWPTTSSKRGR